MSYAFFRISYHHKHKDQVLTDIERYADPSAGIMICLETSTKQDTHKRFQGEHYHVCVEEPFDWKNYRNTILVNHYKLNGKAKKDMPTEYMKSHEVRDEQTYKIYMVKDKNENNIYKNIDIKTIQDYIARSYKKEDRRSFFDELMNHLVILNDSFIIPPHINESNFKISYGRIESECIQFIADKGKETNMSATKSKIKSFVTQFLMYHFKTTTHYENHEIVEDIDVRMARWEYIMRN